MGKSKMNMNTKKKRVAVPASPPSTPDTAALVAANMGLVHYNAKKFSVPEGAYEDLIQEGVLGLLHSFKSFDPRKGTRATHATWWIRAYMRRFLANHNSLVRRREGRCLPDYSLDAPWGTGEGEDTYLDTLAAPTDVVREVEEAERAVQLRALVSRLALSPLERDIVQHRFLQDPPLILEEVGAKHARVGQRGHATTRLTISRERVRQVEAKLRAKLKTILARYDLAPA